MYLCSKKHTEIAFEGWDAEECPVCKLIHDYEFEIRELKTEIEELRERINYGGHDIGRNG